MLQNCCFRILFQFHHSLYVETCIHPSHTAHKNCLCNSFLKQLYAVTPLFTRWLPFYPHWCLAVAAAHIVPSHQSNVHNYPPPSSVVLTLHHWFSQLLYNFLFPPLLDKMPFSNFQSFMNILAPKSILLLTISDKGNSVRYLHPQFPTLHTKVVKN